MTCECDVNLVYNQRLRKLGRGPSSSFLFYDDVVDPAAW